MLVEFFRFVDLPDMGARRGRKRKISAIVLIHGEHGACL